jgi:hypothetical protein
MIKIKASPPRIFLPVLRDLDARGDIARFLHEELKEDKNARGNLPMGHRKGDVTRATVLGVGTLEGTAKILFGVPTRIRTSVSALKLLSYQNLGNPSLRKR